MRCSVCSHGRAIVEAANRLLAAAVEIQQFCEDRHWRFCFIGGIAVQHWGEQRATRAADLTVFTGVGDESAYVDALLGRFESRLEGARDFALQRRVLLLRASNGIPLDVSLGALGFEDRAVSTSTMEEITPGVRLRLCAPGALVVFKAFAGRPLDWRDIEGIIVRSRKQIDWSDVRRDLAGLLELKGDQEAMTKLETLLAAKR